MDSGLGIRLRRGGELISHLLNMDDLKLYASKRSDLMALLKITQSFSNDIGMEFGVDKCAVINVERGRVVSSENIVLSETIILKSLREGETYKYLGMSEALGIEVGHMKQVVQERFFSRLKKVLKSLLSGGNKVRAFNSWVMPLLIYTFGILKWTQSELDTLYCKVRRGLLNAKNLHNREVCNLRDHFLRMNVGMCKDVVAVDKGLTPLFLGKENWRKPKVLSNG
ncbi:jg25540 [Pararge aegeria aegeria]|uniref:Jg25540 protein n=1 Tax=Pararge aegeria aegeria TaxID=348720 RepID=A0A8S4QX64_9NEOP|nr:jg25540 [Pararge aegeria aegeria]